MTLTLSSFGLDDETTDKIISVQVDDEESLVQFVDIPGAEVRICRIHAFSVDLCSLAIHTHP